MLIRILQETLRRRKRRLLVTVLAVTTGASLAAALLGISLNITSQMGRELRVYGANILVSPSSANLRLEVGGLPIRISGERALLDETELIKLKTIFWRNNVVGFAPYLTVLAKVDGTQVAITGTWFDQTLKLPKGVAVTTGFAKTENAKREATFSTGVKTITPWWRVEGQWVQDGDTGGAMVGASLARKLGWEIGDEFTAQVDQRSARFKVLGLVKTGGFEEDQVFVSLPAAQSLLGLSTGAERVLVSALVEPEEKLRPDLRGLDPSEMTPEQYATWYCSPIMAAVVTQIQEVLPGAEVGPIQQISQAEAGFLAKIGLLMTLLTLTALAGSALAVMTTMTASVIERRGEIGLMKALGADNTQVAAIFLSESALIGLAGGGAGYLLGLGLAQVLSRWVFSGTGQAPIVVLPVTLLMALGVALFGSILPVRQALRFEPALLLRKV